MVLIGTSGWQYADWRGRFYKGVPQKQWLAYYARQFPVVEVNNTFYRLPQRQATKQWREQTPDGFLMAAKMSRYLTHNRRLRDPQEPIARFFDRLEPLGDRLGPVLIQLAPNMRADVDVLDGVLRAMPKGVRVAVEPRHPSWWADGVRTALEKHKAALCWADRLGRAVTPLWRTAKWGYVRLHEGRAEPRPRYGERALKTWSERIAGLDPAFVFFNNDPGGAAVEDARTLSKLTGSTR
jgi:uncharacterized protein YecE (DUF72 family)